MPPAFEDLTSTFVFAAGPHTTDKAVLAELPKGLPMDPSRQRQGHRKSKLGCDNCKKRRVKCNEELPCAGCRRRGEWCERPDRPDKPKAMQEMRLRKAGQDMPKPMTTMVPSIKSTTAPASDAVVNLLHLKLLHHFQAHTAATLVFDTAAWEAALQLSFQFEFLANAVLCVSARHLSSLSLPGDPEAASYAAAASSHLCRALAGFRQELQTKDFFTATHLDAFIATSTLLQFELWSSTDFVHRDSRTGTGLDMERDRLFTFSASLKQVFLQSVPEALRRQPDSVFIPYIQHNPAVALNEHARISSETAEAYREYFARRSLGKAAGEMRNRLEEKPPLFVRLDESSKTSLWKPRTDPATTTTSLSTDDGGYAHVVDGLCLLMSFLLENQPSQSDSKTQIDICVPPHLLVDLTRCVFSFPILCRGTFVALVHNNDLDAFFVLYHFYRTVRRILPEKTCWWAHGRAKIMENYLHDWLQNE